MPLHATSLALHSACSSGDGIGGCGPGYPFGKRVRFAVRVVLRMKAGERKLYSMCGSSLSTKGVMEDAVMDIKLRVNEEEKRSWADTSSERKASGCSA